MGNLSSAKSFLDPRQVSYLIFYVTNRCNFRCKFCFYYAEIEKGRKPNELSLDEIDQFSRQLGPLLQLSLTGGEPFLRKDFAELTDIFIRNCDPRYITIPTNASLTDRMARFLEDVLPQLGQAVFLDDRVLWADRGSWPASVDRFSSDLLRPEAISDPFIRRFTLAAMSCPVPVVLGGHSLVSGGLRVLIDAAWASSRADIERPLTRDGD